MPQSRRKMGEINQREGKGKESPQSSLKHLLDNKSTSVYLTLQSSCSTFDAQPMLRDSKCKLLQKQKYVSANVMKQQQVARLPNTAFFSVSSRFSASSVLPTTPPVVVLAAVDALVSAEVLLRYDVISTHWPWERNDSRTNPPIATKIGL